MSRIRSFIGALRDSESDRVALGALVTQHVEPVRVHPEEMYVSLGVKWHGEGIFAREPKLGREIKGSTLYRVKPGQFIYNRMFVTEGSFGLVPDELAHGVVSNEFPTFDVDRTRVNPAWLLLKFQDPATVRTAAAEAEGSTRSRRRWKESQFKAFEIDLPPLAIQDEIVRVLGTMRGLRSSLEAELAARRRQYAHYRDRLLNFSEKERVRWAPMSEVGQFFRGRRFTRDDLVIDGLASIHYGDIYTKYGVAAEKTHGHVRREMATSLRFARTGDVVIAAVGETVEDVAKAVAWVGHEDVAIHDDTFGFRHPMNPKFVSYYMQSSRFHAEKEKYVTRAKVKRISGENLGRIPIPVPEPAEQERIVAILDRFDGLLNDRSIGLPAEIAARRKQYEYYRDKLLTFEEAT